MPAALRPDDDVGIAADADRIRMTVEFRDHLHIVEVGEHQFMAAFEQPKAETAPEIDQAFLGVAVEPAIALDLAQLDAGAHQLEGKPRIAEFPANRETLDLGEVREVPD